MPESKFKYGDTVRLIRDPSAKGFIQHIYERGLISVRLLDGTTELCQPEEIELN
jgi:hypothetical protein